MWKAPRISFLLTGGTGQSGLQRGRSARRYEREIRTGGQDHVLRERQGRDRLEQQNGRNSDNLRGCLMAEVAVRAAGVVIGALVVPVTDHTRRKYQERKKPQGNAEDLDRLSHSTQQS